MGGFLGALTGSSQREDARYGLENQSFYLDRGLRRALSETDDGLEKSLAYLHPYMDGGKRSMDLYYDAIGVNGQSEAQGFQDNFVHDAGYEAQLNAGLDAVERRNNARGVGLSGRAMEGLYDHGRESERGAFNDRLSQLFAGGQSGQQAANASAAYQTQASTRRGDLKFGTNQLLGNAHQGYANQAAQSKTAGLNNVIGLGTAAAQIAMGMPPTGLGKVGQSSGGSGGGSVNSLASIFQPNNSAIGNWDTTTYRAPSGRY